MAARIDPTSLIRSSLIIGLGLCCGCFTGLDGSGNGGGGGDGTGGSGAGEGEAGTGGGSGESGGSSESGDFPVPEIPPVCEGFEAQDVSNPAVTIEGGDCNEDAIRNAVEAGGTVLVRCEDPVVFSAQMVVTSDTVLDGDGMTVLDGGGATRLLMKVPGPTLHVQNITLQNARAPEALGDPQVTQADWFDWAGGAILAECHNADGPGGALIGKNLSCRDNATGANTLDPNTGQILDTGNGGCIYSFMCQFHCDECEFTGNSATLGGAIGTLGAKTQLTNSTCVGNEARYDASSNSNQGFGGCYYQDGTETGWGEDETNYVHMCGNLFADNNADESGGAVSLFYRQYTRTSFQFVSNVCEANSAGDAGGLYQGGGCLYSYVDVDTTIPWAPDEGPDEYVVTRNAFIDNSAEYAGGGALIYNIWQTAARFDNNLFLRNEVRTTDQSTGGGGGAALYGAFFDVEHNAFIQNRASNWTAGLTLGAGGVALRNNLFFDNNAPSAQGTPPVPSEHVNWMLDEVDDGQDNGFLVFASGGNLFFPAETPQGEPRPTPGAAVVEDPRIGELQRDTFPYFVPLSSDSPAIDAGIAVEAVDIDMRGVARDAAPDIGAVEYDG
ncbi:MAG: hypothetical protein K0V04_20475 [Deltaproteobacteria bacterium]|nr:hypothetical protein [Deltaproteobacteria bacterium]